MVTILVVIGKKKGAAFLSLGAAVILALLSMNPVSDLLLSPLENAYPVLDFQKADIAKLTHIVVLGGGMVDRSPEENMKGSLGPDSMKRLSYGVRIASYLEKPLIFSGGRAFGEPGLEPEAATAERYLAETKAGVPTLFEDQSRTTWENARFVREKYKVVNVVLVTSAYHMPRAMLSFKKNGMNPIPAPTDYMANRSAYGYNDYLPSIGALVKSWTALHEYAGMVSYIFR
jgi:uncharacterized SAM-binding protein YcdF (DUF218 family)